MGWGSGGWGGLAWWWPSDGWAAGLGRCGRAGGGAVLRADAGLRVLGGWRGCAGVWVCVCVFGGGLSCCGRALCAGACCDWALCSGGSDVGDTVLAGVRWTVGMLARCPAGASGHPGFVLVTQNSGVLLCRSNASKRCLCHDASQNFVHWACEIRLFSGWEGR